MEGMTSETPTNSYSAHESLIKCPHGKRIDYVMVSSRKGLQIETLSCVNPFPSRVEGHSFSYSDHEAVCTKLLIMENEAKNPDNNSMLNDSVLKSSLEEALDVCDSALQKLATDKFSYWVIFGAILVLISALPHSSPNILHYLFAGIRVFLVLAATFCVIMASAWNRIERHGILAGKLGMQIRLNTVVAKKLPSSPEI